MWRWNLPRSCFFITLPTWTDAFQYTNAFNTFLNRSSQMSTLRRTCKEAPISSGLHEWISSRSLEVVVYRARQSIYRFSPCAKESEDSGVFFSTWLVKLLVFSHTFALSHTFQMSCVFHSYSHLRLYQLHGEGHRKNEWGRAQRNELWDAFQSVQRNERIWQGNIPAVFQILGK